MTPARTRWFLVVAAGVVLLLFTGRWGAGLAVERWWAAGIAPDAVGFLTRWQLLRSGLEIGGILVASAWCVGHLLLVVRSIGTVQIPRRVGDLEIREALGPETLRTAAVVLGIFLGILVGRGGADAAAEVMLAWRGVRFGVVDPSLQLDAGVYIAQMPFWDRLIGAATFLVWIAAGLALAAHLAVGGIRVARTGIAMTDPARTQVGWLLAGVLFLGAVHEALAPVSTIGVGDPWSVHTIPPMVHWVVATTWAIAALMLARWTTRPAPATLLVTVTLWVCAGIVSRVILPGRDITAAFDAARLREIASVNTGLGRMQGRAGPSESGIQRPASTALWSRELLWAGLEGGTGELLALAPARVPHDGAEAPVWLGVRDDSAGGFLFAIADDRLAPGGGTISFRRGDSADYPGSVSWERIDPLALRPKARDTVVARGRAGVQLGATLQRLVISWGAQSTQVLPAVDGAEVLAMRRDPRERAAHLLPAFWWGGATPVVDSAGLNWLVDGWATSTWAPFSTAIDWWEGAPRYARPAVIAWIDARTGRTRIFLRADADAVGEAWMRIASGLIEPWKNAPPLVRSAPMSRSWLAVQALALSRPPFVTGEPSRLDGADSEPEHRWNGTAVEWQLPLSSGGRVVRLLTASQEEGVARTTVTDWADTAHAPLSPARFVGRWERFASFERLRDSVNAAGGRLFSSSVLYEVGPAGTSATQFLYLMRRGGPPALGWVNVAGAGKLGAARTPGAAWANLLGESAPLVPEPEIPDRMVEARRWAARADSALRAGDLEGFGRAFEALKQVLGTP